MDILSLLSYVNKISLIAFFVTTVVVGYQIYLLKKDKTTEQKPSIPDFNDAINSNQAGVINYTQLPGSFLKKEVKQANYSKLVFFIISLLTLVVVIFIVFLIKKNNITAPNQAIVPTLAPTVIPKQKIIAENKPTVTISVIPTQAKSTPTPTLIPSPSPTEIILAVISPKATYTVSPTSPDVTGALRSLPVTGNIGKGLILIGAAVSTIFLSLLF